MALVNFSTNELKAELERREQAVLETLRPALLPAPHDPRELLKCCRDFLDQTERFGRDDDDFLNPVFEAAMEMFYGKNVWKFIDTRVR